MNFKRILGKIRLNNKTKKQEVTEIKTKIEATPKIEAPATPEPCSFKFENGLHACLVCNKPGCCLCCRKSSDINPAESNERLAHKQQEKQKTGVEAGFYPDCGSLFDCKTCRLKFKTGFAVYPNGKPCVNWISAVLFTELSRRLGQDDFWIDGR